MDNTEKPWSEPVAVEDIPETGQHIELEAPEAAREAIARRAALRTLPQLSAEFDLRPQGASVRVSGRVNARVGQTCVITLEPIENDVAEVIDLVFAPAAAAKKSKGEGGKTAQSSDEGPEP